MRIDGPRQTGFSPVGTAQFAARALGFAALYFAFAGTISLAEAAAAAGAGLSAAALRTVLEATGRPYARASSRLARLAPGLLRVVVTDCLRLSRAFAFAILRRARLRGAFVTIPFDVGAGDAEDRTRRGLVVACSSLAPASYAVAIRHEKNLLLRHDLIAKAAPHDRLWPL